MKEMIDAETKNLSIANQSSGQLETSSQEKENPCLASYNSEFNIALHPTIVIINPRICG